MAKRPPTRRRTQPDKAAQPDDVFVAQVFELSTWAQKNSQILILAGIALALVIGGAVYYASYRSDVNRQAIQELEAVQQVVAFGLPEEAEIRLGQYLERFGDTRHGIEAELLLGQVHLQQGRPAQAVTILEDARRSGSDPMRIQLRTLLARAYEEAGRLEDAEREYLSVADDAGMDFQRREALSDAARIRALMGNHAGAVDLYRQILEAMEASDPERGLFEMRLAEAELQASA
jgi:predicted negative regulator of RcsB-dependent stress response